LHHAGFELEGRARAYLKINGVWRDHLLFGRVRPDEPAESNRARSRQDGSHLF
jgi:RimJ/RimL family protein N-acetyltransferase